MFDYKDNLFIYTNRKKKVTNFRKYYLYLQKNSCMKKYFIIFLFLAYTVVNYSQIINPVYDRSCFEVLHPHVDRVEFTNDSTKVYCSINFQELYMYNIPRTMFIEDLKSKKKYMITKCIGLPFEPEKRAFDSYKTYQFIFCFPYIDNLQKFNLIEDSLDGRIFNIYGIDLSKTYPQTYNESEYIRFKNMSDFYKSSNINKYVEFEEKELLAAQYIFGNHSLAASSCYYQLGNYYDVIEEYGKAIHFKLRALACDSAQFGVVNKKHPIYASTLFLLSQSYYYNGNDTEYLKCLDKCIKIRKETEDSKGYFDVLNNLLSSGYNHNATLKRISIVKKELQDLPNYINATSMPIAKIYEHIASKYSFIDDYENAVKYCNKALLIINNHKYNNTPYYCDLLAQICKYYQMSGFTDKAIIHGEAAKKTYDSLNIKSLKYAELLNHLARAYGANLNYEKSIQLQITAEEIYKDAQDWMSLAEVYSNISGYFTSAEKLYDAEVYIQKAISIINEHDKIEQYISKEIEETGNHYISNPETRKVLLYRINTNKSYYYQILARIFQKQGRYFDAINAEIKSGELDKEMGNNDSYILHLFILSTYYQMYNKQTDAINCAERGLQLLAKDKKNTTAANMLLATLHFQFGDTINTIKYAKRSINEASLHQDVYSKINAFSQLAYFYWKYNILHKESEQYLDEALKYLKDITVCKLTEMTTEQKQRLWSKYEHRFLLYRNIIEKSDRNADLLSKLFNYTLFSKSLLLDFDIQHKNNNISRLNIDWKDIQQHLSNDAIAIEFIATKEDKGDYCTYHALIIDKNSSSPKMITLYSESKLEEIMVAETRDIRDIVGKLIWEPILEQYAKVKDIYFSPDGILHILPIEYYSTDDTNSMFELYNMYRLSSTKEIVREKEEQHKNSAVLFGGLDYNQLKDNFSDTSSNEKLSVWRSIAERGGFEPLFNTTLETQEIKKILTEKNITTTLFSGETGTEESFRNLSGQNHNIIHLATHGMYIKPDDVDTIRNKNNFDFMESLASLNDPVKEDVTLTHSFLVMAGGNRMISRIPVYDEKNDGILTSKEISQLDLKGVDLVVLSACESALGDISEGGVYGLQRGFKKAGANTILMSLSKVDDEATKILMVEFYRNLMNGKTKRQSLLDAQQHLRNIDNGKFDAPKYWGAFIMLDGID